MDTVARGIYSTDASIYEIEPRAVVVPGDRDDVMHVVDVAREHGIHILPRGAGTSLAGQCTGQAIIIDFSKGLNQVYDVDSLKRSVRVEPGRVRDELNALIDYSGLHFAPETATSNRATVGGMIGNNSSGTRSIVYGKTLDHVKGLEILLATGETMRLRSTSREEWDRIAERDDRQGRLYRGVRDIIEANRGEIAARYPKVMRRVGGYNLDAFGLEGPWNMADLIVGSEGTLATVLEATLNLEPIPAAKAVCVAHFSTIAEALNAVTRIVEHGPSAVEILDKTVLHLAKTNLETRRQADWIDGDPAAVLLVEFFGEDAADAEEKIERLIGALRAAQLGYSFPRMIDPAAQARVWNVRAAGLGLMLGIKGDAKPTAFIEDSAVPLEHLPDYIDEVLALCKSVGVPVAMYAHASVGLIHVRPILDLKQQRDINAMRKISEGTFDLVRKYGGSWSGEHGDGLVRSYQNEKFFGPQLYRAFKEIKALFDPQGIMNPGKIVDAQPMDENLRLGADYKVRPGSTFYHYREDGGFDRAVEMCTGVGACRKTLTGTMCPSYIATRDEEHSTRGRANALRLAMTGKFGPEGMTSLELYRVFDLCIGCKGCKAECPSNVDVAKLKNEFLAGYHERHGVTWREKMFAHAPKMAERLSGRLAPIANWAIKHPSLRRQLEKRFGVDSRRKLPEYARDPFPQWFEQRVKARAGARTGPRTVVLFDDTFMNHHEPRVGRAAVALLERLGYEVELARAGCCGRTLLSQGFLKEAREVGGETLGRLDRYVAQGKPVVVCEPSCLSALTDDLPDLIADADLAHRVKDNVFMIDQFLARELQGGRIEAPMLNPNDRAAADLPGFLIHGHCHQKALYGTDAMKTLIEAAGCEVGEIDSGCCGMAGSFGYEREHYDLAMKIGEDRLFPALRKMNPRTRVVACGFSCRHQIRDATGVRARHWVEAMAGLLKSD